MIVQLYNDGLLRGFKDRNTSAIIETQNTDYRVLDLLGLPRLGKPLGKPWSRTDWGWEIEVDFQAVVRSNKASTRTAGTVRQNSKSKSKKATAKGADSPTRR